MPIHYQTVVMGGVMSLLSALAAAGPLDPPAGPITSTQKPLAEIEPRIAISATNTPGDADSHFRISQGGSYYLTGNLDLPSTEKAIEIVVSGGQQVTIDLCGFTITATDAARTMPAIGVEAGDSHVSIRNGSIRNWANAIVHFGAGASLDEVRAYDSRLNQFSVSNATFTRCLAEGGAGGGFFVSGSGALTDCLARTNGGIGFSASNGGIVVRGCAAVSNGGGGFALGQGVAESCRADSNEGDGFSGPGAMTNCTSVSNSGHGVTMSGAGTVRGCAIISNSGEGVHAASVVRIEGNTITSNREHGVNIGSTRTVVVGNIIGTNGRATGVFAGVFCSASDCVIDSNQITNMTIGDDDFAVQVTGSSNLIVRNQISNVATALSLASGNTSGGTSSNPVTAGPWANLLY